jgi:hydroxylaminobenzene mutase
VPVPLLQGIFRGISWKLPHAVHAVSGPARDVPPDIGIEEMAPDAPGSLDAGADGAGADAENAEGRDGHRKRKGEISRMGSLQHRTGHRLIQLGVLLFLLGLLVGFVIPLLANPRAGLTSHLEGVMNGMFLILLGLIWPRLELGSKMLTATFWLVIYGTFLNFGGTFLAGLWDTGRFMPIASPEPTAAAWQENVVDFCLFSISFAMVIVCGIVLYGLRRVPEEGGKGGLR